MSFPGLMEDFAEWCTLLIKVRESDGEGGWRTVWKDGEGFRAAIVHDSTLSARVAEAEGMTSTYTVTTEKGMPLDFQDVFRRESDGQIFRVTSDGTDKLTPDRATFDVSQVTAQRWTLPS